MRIINLTSENCSVYSSNAYLILGSWSAIGDVNTLIDTGCDQEIINALAHSPTGVGKKAVEQIILTHNHSDHKGMLGQIKEKYNPKVYAYSPGEHVDKLLKNGQMIKCGDRHFEVIHTPGHSNDSICLYSRDEGVLFVGDTNVVIHHTDSSYDDNFVHVLERLCRLEIRSIYFGHDKPMLENAKEVLKESLRNVRIAVKKRR